jgi:hypothetical protein
MISFMINLDKYLNFRYIVISVRRNWSSGSLLIFQIFLEQITERIDRTNFEMFGIKFNRL